MARIRLEMNSDGFREILSGPEVEQDLRSRAERIADAAGPGMSVEVIQGSFGGGRKVAFVSTDTVEAMRAEAEGRALTAALDAGRG